MHNGQVPAPHRQMVIKNVKLQFSQSTLKASLGNWGGFYFTDWKEESQIDNYDPVDVTNEDFSFCFLTRKDAGSAIILAGSTYTSCNLEQNTNGKGWKLQALVDPKFLANAKVVCEASCITIGE